jgi:hypothetical protein
MTREQVRVGVAIRVTRDRWDARAGTLAEVISAGCAGILDQWRFTVRWHRPPDTKRAVHRDESLNLFESDLADFELFTGPLPSIYSPQQGRGRAIIPQAPSPQLALPYTADDFVSAPLDLDSFLMPSDQLRDIYMDL